MRISFSGATLAASDGILVGDGEPHHIADQGISYPRILLRAHPAQHCSRE